MSFEYILLTFRKICYEKENQEKENKEPGFKTNSNLQKNLALMTIFKINSLHHNFVKICLILIAFFSILTAIDSSGQITSFLTLSSATLEKNYLWQLITYIFLLPNPAVSTGFILRLAINLYIFWFCTTFITKWKGSWQLFFFIFSVTVFLTFIALTLIPLFPQSLFGLNILMCSIAIAWLMLAGDLRFHLYTFTLKAKWIVINLILLRIIYNFFSGFYLAAILCILAALFTYLYALIIWRHKSPFPVLSTFEEPLTRLFQKKDK